MKAITLFQPWASLIMDGRKTIETRSWKTNYRGVLAIHAGRICDTEACQEAGYGPDTILRRAILGVVELYDVFRFTPENTRDISEEEKRWGNFYPGRYGFRFRLLQHFDQPITGIRGSWQLWACEALVNPYLDHRDARVGGQR